MTAIKHI